MPVVTKSEARDAAEGVGLAFIVVVVLIVLALIVGAGLWALDVFTSGVKGAGDVKRRNNGADNRIAAQAEFNRLWTDIQAYHGNIAAAAAAVKINPADTYQLSVLTAEQQTCRTAVGQYNADILNVTMKDWRPAEDPASLDPAQECETTP